MIIDSQLAEFIGILLGDGSLYAKEINGQNRLKITFHSEETSYICFVKNLMTEIFCDLPIFKARKHEKTAELFLFKRKVINELLLLGIKLSPKRNNAVIPHSFLNTALELDVLRGYFDTDGSVVLTNNNGILYPRLEMKVCPSPMQKQFPDILRRRGFKFGFYDCGNGEKRIQMNGKTQLKKWLNLIGFHNSKHIEKAKRILNSGGWSFLKPRAA